MMKIKVELENGLLPDKYGKYASSENMLDGRPVVSFPVKIEDVPEDARSLALVMLDWDSIPVCGFAWIHWTACDIAPNVKELPENASQSGIVPMTQGANSDWSKLAGSCTDPQLVNHYTGPYPPDKTHVYTLDVYALDCELGLKDGFYLNELLHAMDGHVLAKATQQLPSRA